MKPTTISIYELFQMERRYVVPLFQRPYVWTRERQWEPLWEDIALKADEIVEYGGNRSYQFRKHFLGAVVLNQIPFFGLDVAATEVIDGQQRLTTLQVLMIALRDYTKAVGYHKADQMLQIMTRNSSAPANGSKHQQYKVWATTTDRAVFEAVWECGSPAALERLYPQVRIKYTRHYATRHPLVEAYLYFYDAIRQFA